MRKKIKCPHCGSESGLEHRIYMKGYDLYTGNGELEEEGVTEYNSRKTMTCRNCGKRVMTYEEFKRDYYVDD
jgi:transcription elongation factor Elf1